MIVHLTFIKKLIQQSMSANLFSWSKLVIKQLLTKVSLSVKCTVKAT